MSSEVKSVLTPTLWAALAVVSVVMSLIGVLTSPFAPSWTWSILIGSFTAPMIVLFIVLIIAKAIGRTVSQQTLALLYAATAMSVVFCYSMIPYGILHNAVAVRQNQYDWHPSNWVIKDLWVFGPIVSDPAEMVPITEGRAPVPWDRWSPFLGWWITYTIFWLLFFVGWIALLEERWIRIEKLPYPASLTGTLQIQLINQKEDPRLKFFLLGFILGALVILPLVAVNLNPAIPDIYGWSKEPFLPWFVGTMDFSRLPVGAAIPVIAFLPVNPMIYVLFYLFPAKILFSMWVFSLFGVLIPSQIAFYMGYYSDLPTMANRFHAFMNGAPFRWNGWWIGSLVGLILTWFFLNISYLKGIFKKPSTEMALPGLVSLLMIVVSTVVLIALLIVAGVNPVGALIIIFTMWVLFLSAARIFGFSSLVGTAWGFPIDWSHFPFLLKHLYLPDPGARTAEMTATLWLGNRWTGELMGENNTNFGMVFTIPFCYKIGYDTGTHPRDITKIILTSGILSAIIGYPVGLWMSYTAGTNNTRMGLFDAWWHWVFGAPWSDVADLGISEPLLPYVAAGMILTIVLSVLNFRFVWWPLDPAGVAMALGASGTGWLLPALVGWIAKTLVIRVGGTKLNDNVAVPIVIGFLVGYWLLLFLGGLIAMIQFFMPA
jgi:hypothetical protein